MLTKRTFGLKFQNERMDTFHTKAQLRQLLHNETLNADNLIDSMQHLLYDTIGGAAISQLEPLAFDDHKNAVNGPGFTELCQVLNTIGMRWTTRQMILTHVYRSWIIAARLQQYSLAHELVLCDPEERESVTLALAEDHQYARLWKKVCEYRTSFLWSKVRKWWHTRRVVVYWIGRAAETACAEGGAGRERDIGDFVQDFIN